MKPLTIVSFNAGLLNLSVCGWTILEPAAHIEERLTMIPNALKSLDADIILLQEVYKKNHGERIQRELGLPYAIGTRDHFPMRSGLLFLSKHPITEGGFTPFKTRLIEDRVADKGMITARIKTPIGDVAIANVHPTAGGLHPEAPKAERVRSNQLKQATDELERPGTEYSIRVLGGDFNAGPEASKGNFRELLEKGYRDSFRNQESQRFSWDPNNPLNANGPHAHCPPQRCDHILVRDAIVRAESKIVLTDPIVPVPSGTCTLSDHYGVLATIYAT